MRNLALLLIATILTACSQVKTTTADMKLYVFECGSIVVKDISNFNPGVDVGIEKELTDSCYLIQHNDDYLIWDTGLNDTLVDANPDDGFQKTVTKPLMAQLEEINVTPKDVDYIGISHSHFDHTGNANAFSNAKLIVQEEEFKAMFIDAPNGFLVRDDFIKLNQDNAIKLHGDYDVFEDGRVIIKRAVGHTPGHQALFIDLPKEGPIVLSGDLYHFTKNRENRGVPGFNSSKEGTLESMDSIEAFVKEKDAQFWIQHDKEQNATIRHSPAFYE